MKDQMQRQKPPGNSAKRKLDFIRQTQSEDKRDDNFYGPAVQKSQSTRTKFG